MAGEETSMVMEESVGLRIWLSSSDQKFAYDDTQRSIAHRGRSAKPTNPAMLLNAMRARPKPVELIDLQDQVLVIDDAKAGLHLRNCVGCWIDCTTKPAQITLQDCRDVNLVFESVLSSVEAIRCTGLSVTYRQQCGTIVLDGASHVRVNIPVAANAPWIVCTNVSGLHVRAMDAESNVAPLDVDKIEDSTQLSVHVVENQFVVESVARQALFSTTSAGRQ
ncbi:hypothetical protein Ae201684P_019205 [Aphanomyces euteiches]|uniref:C-CAP/cofactor C-like domain-containing protein n=2 Tax=Aphanomyces euteiches TaxID=100861 RepID=A0A6G0WJ16_9STRA|nr:hypothetical protein Ae201684_014743 [Aphanomyces euteiches]KAH9078103.1 hypothetical protein Ae201684P_019205 [Aphanomyces euteiches]KAH9157995.1 hypothetical protein AeRB84_000233 [Aphanomyces euteiches]